MQPDRRIPAQVLARADGIILLNGTKAGFLFAYQAGSGVALSKDAASGKWSPAVFVRINEGSLGFQVGGEQNFIVILLMNPTAMRLLTGPNYAYGSEARATAGITSAGVEAVSPEQPVLVYSDRKGLYAGADLKSGALTPDEEANRIYYGQFLTMNKILFGQNVKPTQATSDLVKAIGDYSTVSKP